MTTPVRFWIDPVCPWCWVTSRWIRTVASERDLEITWEPISLLVKNQTGPDSPWYAPVKWSFGLLRVLEAVRKGEGGTAVGDLYLEYGRRIQHDSQLEWDVTEALTAIGLSADYAAAFSDESWDAEVQRRHDEGLALVGNDVGTPIIGILDGNGKEVGIFGPVITAIPADHDDALRLWDSITFLATLPEFHELKRTRQTGPNPGERP